MRLQLIAFLVCGLWVASAEAREPLAPEAVEAWSALTNTLDSPAEDEAVDATVGWLELSGPLREGPVPFAFLGPEDVAPSLRELLAGITALADDEQSAGLVVWLEAPELTLTQAASVADAFTTLRDAGKFVAVFAESLELRDYLLASAADEIWLLERGDVMLSGLAMEEMYLADMLEKVGVSADFVQVGEFKGADEQLTRSGPSEAWSANIDGLLDGLYGQLIGRIAQRRGLKVSELESAMAGSFAMRDEALVEAGLIDRLVKRDLKAATADTFGDGFRWVDLDPGAPAAAAPTNPMAIFATLFQPPAAERGGPAVAVVHATGPIMSGYSGVDDGLFSTASIGSRSMTETLAEAADDDDVRAIVIRLDSPGGSALASEVVWQAVRAAAERKPVLLSVGDMAASGGYYIASGAQSIYAEPESIVGSIGVVGGKLVLNDLYDMIGLNVKQRTRGPNGAIFSSLNTFSDDERELVRQSMELVYEQFLERIRTGRGDRIPDLDDIDEGLLFTGAQALELGMVDAIGNLDQAIAAAAEAAGLEPDAFTVRDLPRPRTLQDFLGDVFQVAAPSLEGAATGADAQLAALRPLLSAAEALLGPGAGAQLRESLRGIALLRDEPVLLMHPTVLRIR